jgi:hypothetical protein
VVLSRLADVANGADVKFELLAAANAADNIDAEEANE